MRSVQPNADLPASNSQTMLGYNSLPSRPQRTNPRNMTGIYLGSEPSSRASNHTRHSIPPLAKPRGVNVNTRGGSTDRRRRPAGQSSLESNIGGQLEQGLQGTPMYDPGIVDPDCVSKTLLYIYHQPAPAPIALPYTSPMILRLPILRPKQQQRVESLRMHDEPRGFKPIPPQKITTKPKTTSRRGEEHICSSSGKHALDYSGITRKTGRNFVPVANSGVKRLEDLRNERGSIIPGSGSVRSGHTDVTPHHPSPVQDKTRNINNNQKQLIGLEDCYKKICKGNLSNLHTLILKKQGPSARTRARMINTPLTIRSFRNPQSPHPVIQYSDPKHRPKTTIATPTMSRPPVPSPYFYNSKSLPRTADDGSSRVKLTRDQECYQDHHRERILASPGAGVISGSAFRKRGSFYSSGSEVRPPSGIAGKPPPCLATNTKIYDSDEMFAQRDGFRVPSGTPAASNTDLTKMETSEETHETQYSANIAEQMKQSSQTTVPPPSPATLHHMKISSANKNNSGSDYDSEYDTRDGVESTVSLPTIGTRPGTRGEHKLADSGIEEQDEGVGSQGNMRVSIIISVEDEMGRHIDVNIEDEAGQMDVETPAASPVDMQPVPDDNINASDSNQSISEEIAEAVQEAAIQKQSELQRLIEEHNELVAHIEELEKKKSSFSDDDLSDSDDESPMATTPS